MFSPQFMVSSQRNIAKAHGSDSSAIENFTLTWDQSSNPHLNKEPESDLFLRMQQEMMELRLESQRILTENLELKSENEVLMQRLSHQEQPHHYSDVVEQFKETALSLQRRIDDLELQRQRTEEPMIQQQINQLRQSMRKFEMEN